MEKYLLQIIETNNRVIVPEFGAFIVKQKKPLVILFNEFLQYNDGVLVDTVAAGEKIDKQEAKKKIEEFIVDINSALEKNGIYRITGIGILTKNPSGKITVEKDESKPAGKSKVKQNGPARKPDSKESEPKNEVVKKDTEEPTLEISDEKTEIKSEETESQESAPVQPAELPDKEVEATEATRIIIERTEAEFEPEKPVIKVFEEKPWNREQSAESKTGRGKSRLLIWLLVILLVNGVLIGYFIYSDQLTGLFTGNQTEEQDLIQTENNDLPDPEEIPSGTSEEVSAGEDQNRELKTDNKITPEYTTSSEGQFHIVAGVFRDESNADKLVEELRRKGYPAKKFGKIGSLFAVSYNNYPTKADADAALQKIKKDIDPEAWIREVK